MKKIADSKIKILIGVLVVGILVIGGWWVLNSIITKKEPFIPPHWKICNLDSDCVETQAGCCRCTMGGVQTAINKKYLNKWEEKLKKFCQGIVCPAVVRCKNGKVICENNKCKFVPKENKVLLTTDKTKYTKNEEIKLTVINNFDKPIYYHDWSRSWNECGGSSFKLGKKIKEDEFDFFEIGLAECLKPIVSLKPLSKITYSLDPKELEKIPSRSLKEGTYKWEFTFGFEKDLKSTQKVYSNEFTIKENTFKAEDICDVGEGDFGNGIFRGDNPNLDTFKSQCEQKPECEWKSLGGKKISHYACCLKDLKLIVTDEDLHIYERCFVRID